MKTPKVPKFVDSLTVATTQEEADKQAKFILKPGKVCTCDKIPGWHFTISHPPK